ncbi:MAG: hypothetical protein U0166_13980 [Acidobacteriota bacterium]
MKRPPLRKAIALLLRTHGAVAPPPATDPFAMIVWENVAYLVDDARRRRVFDALGKGVGIDAGAILAAPGKLLRACIADGGMDPPMRARKLREAARIASELAEPLAAIVASDPVRARRTLRKFPGIGEPGAEKILLFTGKHAGLAPESNGLRVLLRLGFGEEGKSYAASYRSAGAAVARELPDDPRWLREAHLLLRKHGQEMCRRSEPLCEVCPLRDVCAHASA